MGSTIESKIQYASIAYQHFLVAVKTDQDCLDQVRAVFEHQFGMLVSQLSLHSENKVATSLRTVVDLQVKIQNLSAQFEHLYLGAFKQFKQQHSVLIDKDAMKAFNQWTQMFDTEYLIFLQQESVCREYAEILSAIAQLGIQYPIAEQLD